MDRSRIDGPAAGKNIMMGIDVGELLYLDGVVPNRQTFQKPNTWSKEIVKDL
jgi:hypothetical protein